MFTWRKKDTAGPMPPPPPRDPRELLFGDVPLTDWCGNGDGEPWASFKAAHGALRERRPASARAVLTTVAAQPHLESRHYLQAWHMLRRLGVAPPPEQGKHLYGVVIDVPIDSGLDTLAAYEDGSARYFNHRGAAIVWEHPDASLSAPIANVLAAGRELVQRIGSWEGARPELPPGQARISLLTPSGLHFGQAPFEVLSRDPMAARIVQAGTALMQTLIATTT